jgi:hypothetical protein
MKTMFGYVNDRYTYAPLKDVSVYAADSNTIAYTDSTGYYEISIPRKNLKLYFHHNKYKSEKIGFSHTARRQDARMAPIAADAEKYGKPAGRNAISWLPTKLIWGAVGLRYERFIGSRFSIGTYADWYFTGQQYFGDEEYTGIKVTPAFRYFFRHHEALGFYIQASAIIGYFDFSKLNYVTDGSSSRYVYSVADFFWTGGAGFGVGAYFSFSRKNTAFLDLNVGWQILPANYPSTVETPFGSTYEHYNTWWYMGGPGSFIEIKIAIGGIF